jgi:hypothetical protein
MVKRSNIIKGKLARITDSLSRLTSVQPLRCQRAADQAGRKETPLKQGEPRTPRHAEQRGHESQGIDTIECVGHNRAAVGSYFTFS